MNAVTAPSVIADIQGRAGVLTLNRPEALNALNLDMVRLLTQALEQWRADDAVSLVIIRGAGERGLCAGGDIVSLYEDALRRGTDGAVFWKEEYELVHAISTYPKPVVALMEGIVLGGGIGLSAHASHRIVTDNSRIGMPEVGIGYSPDVGGSFLLSRHVLGRHLAYTGQHVGAAEALEVGIADTFVPRERLPELVAALADAGTTDPIASFVAVPAGPAFDGNAAEMEKVYAAGGVEEILAALDGAAGSEWAGKAAAKIRAASPLGVKVTEESLRRGATMDLAQALTSEFWMSLNMQRDPEFAEGIRAQVIDKDRKPRWRHASLADVDDVTGYFEPLPGYTAPEFSRA